MALDDKFSLRDIIDSVGYLGDRDVIDRLVPDRMIRAGDRLRRQMSAARPLSNPIIDHDPGDEDAIR